MCCGCGVYGEVRDEEILNNFKSTSGKGQKGKLKPLEESH